VANRSPSQWSAYYASTLDKPLHPHYAKLDPHLPPSGKAIDLGCGVGQGVVYLASKGFHVTAVDGEQEALDILHSRLPSNADANLICSSFQNLALGTYDVVVAHFSLFFLPEDDFEKFWPRVVHAMRGGGLLSVQFLGKNDEWAALCTTHTRNEVEAMLAPFDLLSFEEVERDGDTRRKAKALACLSCGCEKALNPI